MNAPLTLTDILADAGLGRSVPHYRVFSDDGIEATRELVGQTTIREHTKRAQACWSRHRQEDWEYDDAGQIKAAITIYDTAGFGY